MHGESAPTRGELPNKHSRHDGSNQEPRQREPYKPIRACVGRWLNGRLLRLGSRLSEVFFNRDPCFPDVAQSPLGLFVKAPPQQSLHRGGTVQWQPPPVRLFQHDGSKNFCDCLTIESLIAREHLVEDASKCPDI